tara:strand:+ start:121 stop:579 length:459 start_codon:yes stop_codon:yes gene_type:complete
MVSNASHSNRELRFIDNKIYVKRGELIFPLRKNAAIWKMPYSTMRSFIQRLKKKRMIDVRVTKCKPHDNHPYASVSIISISNYDKFQAQVSGDNHLLTTNNAILNNYNNKLTNISNGYTKDKIVGNWGQYHIIIKDGKKWLKHKWKDEIIPE